MTGLAVQVLPLTPERLPYFLVFFEGSSCQCFHEDHAGARWSGRTAAQNRARAVERIVQRAMQRHLACADGAVVGWCNAAPRQLPEAACDGLRRQGLRFAEANPRTAGRSAAENRFGPLGLCLAAGFMVHAEDADGSLQVRRAL